MNSKMNDLNVDPLCVCVRAHVSVHSYTPFAKINSFKRCMHTCACVPLTLELTIDGHTGRDTFHVRIAFHGYLQHTESHRGRG